MFLNATGNAMGKCIKFNQGRRSMKLEKGNTSRILESSGLEDNPVRGAEW